MKTSWLIGGVLGVCGVAVSAGACGSSTNPATTLATNAASSTGSHTSTSTGSPTTTSGSPTTTTSGSPTTTSSGSPTTTSGGGSTTTTTSGTGGATTTSTSSGSTCVAAGDACTTSAQCCSVSGTSLECIGGFCNCKAEADAGLYPPKMLDGGGYESSIYCPFSGVDGGKAQYCTAGTEHCCETPEGSATPSACVPAGDGGTACMTGTGYMDWGCEAPTSDCGGSTPICCAPGAVLTAGATINGIACEDYGAEMHNTLCVANGACSGIVLCTSNADCTAAGMTTCVPFSKAGTVVGGCM